MHTLSTYSAIVLMNTPDMLLQASLCLKLFPTPCPHSAHPKPKTWNRYFTHLATWADSKKLSYPLCSCIRQENNFSRWHSPFTGLKTATLSWVPTRHFQNFLCPPQAFLFIFWSGLNLSVKFDLIFHHYIIQEMLAWKNIFHNYLFS